MATTQTITYKLKEMIPEDKISINKCDKLLKEQSDTFLKIIELRDQEISSLNEILSQKMELLVKANEEIERLKFIIGQLYDTERESWQQFKIENNL